MDLYPSGSQSVIVRLGPPEGSVRSSNRSNVNRLRSMERAAFFRTRLPNPPDCERRRMHQRMKSRNIGVTLELGTRAGEWENRLRFYQEQLPKGTTYQHKQPKHAGHSSCSSRRHKSKKRPIDVIKIHRRTQQIRPNPVRRTHCCILRRS